MSNLTRWESIRSGIRAFVHGYWRHPLARRARLRVLGNIVRWQVRSRFSSGDHEVPWIGGTRLSVRRGMTGATGDLYYGLLEFHDMALVMHLLRPKDLFVDVGANVGIYSVLAAGVCGADVVAMEPIGATAERLRLNLALNDLGARSEVIQKCIGDKEGIVHMTQSEDTTNRVRAVGDEDPATDVAVSMTTLDEILAGRAPVMIKIDAEGCEGMALRGAQAVLRSPSLLALSVEGDAGKRYAELDDLSLEDWLRRHDFVPRAYDGNTRTLCAPSAARMCNLLFLRDIPECQRRLGSARSVRVVGIDL